jgi:predicted nucleic acid-binding Zn ribbon protein
MSKFYKNGEYIKRTGTSTLGETINDLLEAYKLTGKFKETQVINNWGKVMGMPIANRTGKVFIKDKKLYVEITSPPLKHQLSMAKTKIVELLNQDAGAEVIDEVILL